MSYYIDLNSISIEDYCERLKSADLLPSRMILKDSIDARFACLKNEGFKTVLELQKILKKKDRLAQLAKMKPLSEEYLIILLREINSMHPKSNKISEFKGIPDETKLKLKQEGIKDTLSLYEKIKTPSSRNELSQKTGISEQEILKLTQLTDLSRIRWVGASFAHLLYETGYVTTEKVAKADYNELHQRINRLNKEKNYFKVQIGLHDMKLCVEAARDVVLEIEY